MPDRGLLAPLSPHEEVTLGAMLAWRRKGMHSEARPHGPQVTFG
jgi:hypothetical protein